MTPPTDPTNQGDPGEDAPSEVEALQAALHEASLQITALESKARAAESRALLFWTDMDGRTKLIESLTTTTERLTKQLALAQTRLAAARGALETLQHSRTVRMALRASDQARRVRRKLRRGPATPRPAGPRAKASTTSRPTSRPTSQLDVGAAVRALRPDIGATEGPLVSLIVLTRDGREHMQRLLRGLQTQTHYRSFELIVVDNGSSDDTAALLDDEWDFPIRVITNTENETFSRGNNQGLDLARGEFTLLLNNDVAPINPGWLGAMVAALQSDVNLGAVGSLLVYPERPAGTHRAFPDGTLQHRGIDFFWVDGAPRARNMGGGEDPASPGLCETVVVPSATAACLLVRTDALRAVGGMSEGYVYGAEDVDLCLKLYTSGHRIAVCGGAALFHHEYGTQSATDADTKRENRRRNWELFTRTWSPWLSRSLRLDRLRGTGFWSQGSQRTVAITLTRNDPGAGYGDYYTAHELGDAFAAQGWSVQYAERIGVNRYQTSGHIDLVISLLDGYDIGHLAPSAYRIAWVRNWGDRWAARPWMRDFDLVVASSATLADIMRPAVSTEPRVLPLAANPERFAPQDADPALATDVVFTGNNWGHSRQVLDLLEVYPHERFALYGRGWGRVSVYADVWKGHAAHDELPSIYTSAKVVLDDTASPTLPYGALNTRVFEALCAGTLVITDNKEGAAEWFGDLLPTYDNAEDLRTTLDRFLADDDLRIETANKLREIVLEHHSYAHRAREFVDLSIDAINAPLVVLKIGTSNQKVAERWGDTHFARDLAAALRPHGVETRIDYQRQWLDADRQSGEAVLTLRGIHAYETAPSHFNIEWVISHPEAVTIPELETYDHVFVASVPFAHALRERATVPITELLQATAEARFFPVEPNPELEAHLLFLGNSRQQRRPAVDWAVELGADLTIVGQHWDGLVPETFVRAEHHPNSLLGELYASADIVLSDHWADMAAIGFISNRVFDALASGAFVISDAVLGMADVFGDAVPVFHSKEELGELLARFGADPAARRRLADKGMRIVRAEHTFTARADAIMAVLRPALDARQLTMEARHVAASASVPQLQTSR